ncbi:MAG: putative periplasmic solute binding protein for transport system [Verrucomicrobiales bacterium]|nr:putative periplasmic solute binding protein for transport system [Verrucomicrobiales bacterium]
MRVTCQLLLALVLTFTSHGAEPPGGKKLRILTTFLPLYCFALNVGGDLAEVENLLPSNISPHDYQFSRRDLQKVQRADVIVRNGAGMDIWLEKLLLTAGRDKKIVVATSGMDKDFIWGVTPLDGFSRGREQNKGVPNPHVWLDPKLAQQMVTNILIALVDLDPTHQDTYRANAAEFLASLQKLHADFENGLGPLRGQALVTLHDAFPYLVRRYGLRLAGVLEQVPDVDPSARYLQAFQDALRKEKIPVLFVEPQYSSRLVRQIAKDLNLKVAELDTLETGPLKKDAYERTMRRNLQSLCGSLTPASHASETQSQ